MGSQRVRHDWSDLAHTHGVISYACILFHLLCLHAKLLLVVSDSSTLWTVAHQAPLSMRFSRQEYWCGLPVPPSRDLPDPGIESAFPMSPALAGRFFTTEPPRKSYSFICGMDTWVSSTFWLLCEWCCYEYGCTNICLNSCFQCFLSIYFKWYFKTTFQMCISKIQKYNWFLYAENKLLP